VPLATGILHRIPCRAASLRRWRASGDLPGGMRMCMVLPVAWRREGAFTVPPVAAYVPLPRPGGTRFYARDVSVGQYFGLYRRTVFGGGYHERAVERTPGEHARQRLGTRVGAVLGWRQGLLCEKMERWRLKWLTSGGHFIISNYY
jgi:hypothetical protein